MPLRTACSSCGKNLQVRDELAGKKVKCPQCGQVFVAAGSAAIKPTAKGAPPPAAKDRVTAKPMAKKPVPPPPDIDDEDDEEIEERPVRGRGKKEAPKARSSRAFVWIVLLLLLVAAGGAGGYWYFFMRGQDTPGPAAKKFIPQPGPTNNGGPPGTGGVTLAELVPGDAMAFASISGDLWNAQALEQLKQFFGKAVEEGFQKELGLPIGDVERAAMFTVVSYAEAKTLGPAAAPFVVVMQTKQPMDQDKVRQAVAQGELGKQKMNLEFVGPSTLVMGQPTMVERFNQQKGQGQRSPLMEKALAAVETSKGIVLAINIPPEAAQEAQPAVQAMPQAAPLLKTKSVLATLDLTDKLLLNVTLMMQDAAAAQEAKQAADGLIGLGNFLVAQAAANPETKGLALAGQQALKDLKVTAEQDELRIAFAADANLFALIMPAIERVRQAAVKTAASNNLKGLALALHGYHDRHKSFPPQIYAKGLSWRVAILPYIEQEQLFKQFKLDEPWDSEHNKKLIPLMPKLFEAPGRQAPPGQTYYQTFVGPNTINATPQKGMHMSRITDGTSNTVVLAEAMQPVEWTKPADIMVDPQQPIPWGNPAGQVPVAFGDGSVRSLPNDLDPNTLRLLIDPTDGKVVNIPR